MENCNGARNSGPVVLPPPPPMAFKSEPAVRRDVVESVVQLVCTNPGCMVSTWMDLDDWEARVTSAQRQRQRGWNGDEQGHVAEQLVCPCGRGWRRRATMPSTSSPAAVAAWRDRLQQLRMMRRSEPMRAADAGGASHLAVEWLTGHQWPFTSSDSDRGPWTSRPAAQPHFGFCSQAVNAERFRAEHPIHSSRHRVLSEPETYVTTSQCVAAGTQGYACPGKIQQSQLIQPVNGYKPQLSQIAPSYSTLNFCDGYRLGGTFSQTSKPSCVDVQGQREQIYAAKECGTQRNQTGLTPRRPSKSDLVSHAVPSVNGDVPSHRPADSRIGSSRRDGASPDSMSSDSASSAGSAGSATGRRKPPSAAGTSAAITGTAIGRASNACSRGNIFRQRTPAELATFRSLSIHCNAYEVQTSGDDAPYGKDRLRTHVLMALSAARRATVDCVICCAQLVVYHDFPLLDGLFFESPMKYNSDVRVEPLTVGGLHRQPLSDTSKFYLNAVCFKCLQV